MRKFALPIALVFGFAVIGCSDDDNCVDVDGDGYGEGSDCTDVDCDDNDADVWMDIDGYPDNDEDGEYAESSISVCTDGTLPAEYSATAGTDCDDSDADAVDLVMAHVDVDEDGFGAAEEVEVCGNSGTSWLPPGYVDNGTDCNDASDVLSGEFTGYTDYDEDTVFGDVEVTVCGTTMAPAYLGDTAGTDCDDMDPYVAVLDATTTAACTFKGVCIDTEAAVGFPDMTGIGACASVDCDGANPACGGITQPPMTDTTNVCTTVNDCNAGEDCWDATGGTNPTCWTIPACCQNDPTTGLHCNEILDCLKDCAALLPDTSAYAQCQQFSCFEAALPRAQHLYRIASECASAAGCWAVAPTGNSAERGAAIEACVTDNCLMEFAPCLLDVAP